MGAMLAHDKQGFQVTILGKDVNVEFSLPHHRQLERERERGDKHPTKPPRKVPWPLTIRSVRHLLPTHHRDELGEPR